MKKNGSFDLERFLNAQAADYETALEELREGKKRSHWMWYIFPQLAGLGHSPMARTYAIQSRDEAVAYLSHPILGQRLRECVETLNGLDGLSVIEILGHVDAMKLRSSLTLFAHVADDASLYREAIDKYYNGEMDRLTLSLLESD